MINEIPRVRFAPSPTGYLHIGGLRTALYNYLFAKNQKGQFILRIEDTDRNRYVKGAVENLITTLKWVGLEHDEGPGDEGKYGPYLQSERLKIYKKHAEELIKNENAYYCFCSPERLKELRDKQQKEGLQPKYDKHCIHLSNEEIYERLNSDAPRVVRLNVRPDQTIIVNDEIRGKVEFDSNIVDDQVLIKSDGFPTYHLANVIDDHSMKITHVIRGEEWLSSTPKHVLLYDFFGWEKPKFAHLPLLLNPDRSKLSKRQGDVAVEDYRAKGYLKEALLNFVALLGWNPGNDQEIFQMEELINSFSLERVNKSGAVFNVEKLNWLNAEHLRSKSANEILPMLRESIDEFGYDNSKYSDDYLILIVDAMRERVSFVKEYVEKCPYFYKEPETYDPDVIKKRWKKETPEHLKTLANSFQELKDPKKEDFENTLRSTAEKFEVGAGKLIHTARLAVSGMGIGPGVFDLLFILGKDECIKRINTAIQKIQVTKS